MSAFRRSASPVRPRASPPVCVRAQPGRSRSEVIRARVLVRAFPALVAAVWLAVLSVGCREETRLTTRGSDEIDRYDDLYSVSVVDAEHVVAVGYFGAAYVSVDAGATWHRGRTPTERSLYSVSMADARVGWSVGQLGTVLRTEDGGRSWHPQENPKERQGAHLFGVHALDANTAIAVGEWGGRIYTEDGGKTWRDDSLTVDEEHPQFVWLSPDDRARVRAGGAVYEDVSLQDVFCRQGSDDCWLVGEFGYVFRSIDRGRTWLRAEILHDSRLTPIPFGVGEVDLAPADAARLGAFAESLASESHLDVQVESFVSDREIRKMQADADPEWLFDLVSARLDGARGVLEAAGLPADRIRITHAPPWDYVDPAESDPVLLDRYLDARRAPEARLMVSTVQNPVLFTIHFANQSEGFISGLGGVVLISVDAGATWRYVESGSRHTWFSVGTSGQRVVAAGEKGQMAVSEDGGRHWAASDMSRVPSLSGFMRDLEFAPHAPSVGFVVGQQGRVLRSRDAGASWSQVLPTPHSGAG